MDSTDTSPRRRRKGEIAILEALAAGHTQTETAKIAGVGRRTVERCVADPLFRAELDEAKRELARQCVASLASAVPTAIARLEVQTQDRDQWLAQKAALGVLHIWARLRETETFDERIAALEERARELAAR